MHAFLVLWVYTQARRGARRNKHDRTKSSQQFARGFEHREILDLDRFLVFGSQTQVHRHERV